MHLPKKLLESLQEIQNFNKEAFEQVHNSAEQVTSIRINPLKSHQFNVENMKASVPWSTHGHYLSARPSFTLDPLLHAGAYYVQEASSMFLEQALTQSLDVTLPLLALDLCAAPGGKSTLIQSILSQESLLISNEVIQSRVNVLKENIIKWGAGNVVVTNNDPKEFSKLKGLFDVLVIDAPCSGSGLFRRDEDAIKEWSIDNVQLCSQRQQRIIADAWDCLKKDGVLIYSTCSYSVDEDEEIMDWMMNELQVESIQLKLEKNWMIDEVQSEKKAFGYRFWPYKVKGEGFFLAAFRKKEETDTVRLRIKATKAPAKKDAAIASAWLQSSEGLSFIMQGQNIAAIPMHWNETIQFLMQELKVRYAGIELGTIGKDDLIPEHALALSTNISTSVFSIELNLDEALNYLRKKELIISSNHKGWALAKYEGYNLGFMKLLGNRINNYYPKEWRIFNL